MWFSEAHKLNENSMFIFNTDRVHCMDIILRQLFTISVENPGFPRKAKLGKIILKKMPENEENWMGREGTYV